jgi:phosphatidylinositol alpha-1,6-mannosyltransferase
MSRRESDGSTRILIVALDFPPSIGGIQEWCVQLARQLACRHHVTVVARRQPGAAAYDAQLPFQVYRVPTLPGRASLLALLAGTLAVSRKEHPSVLLHAHLFTAVAFFPFRRLLPPAVVTTHGWEVQAPSVRRFLHPTLRACRACVAVSTYTAGLLEAHGVPRERIRIIPNGVDAALLSDPGGAPVPEAIEADDRVLLTVARLDERYKGQDVVLRALPLILARVPQARYVVAGDGVHRGYYEQVATALGVAERVTFLGRVDEATRLALYDRCALFVMTSRQELDGSAEGFGIVFLEAAARGKPAIGGRSGGIPDAIEEGVTGLLVDPTDPAAVAAACVRLLTEESVARRLGAAARAQVAGKFTWDQVAVRVERALA